MNAIFSLLRPEKNADRFGSFNPEAILFDDRQILKNVEPEKVASIKVWVDKSGIGGIETIYLVNGQLKQIPAHVGSKAMGFSRETLSLDMDEYLTEVSGAFDAVLKKLVFKTSKGRQVSYGGNGNQHFKIQIPEGHHIVAFTGAVNGYLHNIGVHTAPMKGFVSTGGMMAAGNFQNQVIERSPDIGGKIFTDSRKFDTMNDLTRNATLVKLNIYHDGNFVRGFSMTFRNDAGELIRSGHIGRLKELSKPGIKKARVKLAEGEIITEVLVRSGELIDAIVVKTSKGQTIEAGGKGGGPRPILIPQGRYLVGFYGTYGGFLHRIGAYYR